MKFRLLSILMAIMWSAASYSQLPAFTLSIATENETCPFNGSVTMTTSNTQPGSTIKYSIYLLPNTTSPLDQFTTNTKGNLESGNYRIVATQELGDQSNSETIDFTILDQTVPLDFSVVQSSITSCNVTGGILTVNVDSGKAPFFYEIIAGPITFPFQLSNVFSGLSAGDYTIRVIDACGTGEVLQYKLILDTTILTIGATSFPSVATSCTSIDVLNEVTPANGTNIIYPLTVKYTVHPPSGPDQIIPEIYTTGPTDILPLSLTLSLFGNLTFTYDILITDNCNQPFSSLGNVIDPNMKVNLAGDKNECGDESLIVGVSNFSPPYSISFIDSPPNFNPLDFNPLHNGLFTTPGIFYGTDENTVPPGDYEVLITDNCGRTATASYKVENDPLVLNPVITTPNCNAPNGSVRITIPDDRKVTSATLISAPPEYTQTLPQNVSASINANGILVVLNLPPNDAIPYVFSITDSCNDIYNPVEVTIPTFTPSPNLTITPRFTCVPGNGSVWVRTRNGGFVTLLITEAPVGFPHALPYDVSSLVLNNGNFFMNSLLGGSYKFEGTDTCGMAVSGTTLIPSYNPGIGNYILQRNCGSFHIGVASSSNAPGLYFLQRFDTTTNLWEHPDTGVDYTNPAIAPTDITGLQMFDGITLLNRTKLGTYRIMKVMQTFDNGNTVCLEEYTPFDFFDNLVIKKAYTLDCIGSSGPNSIYLDVEGVPPYIFKYRQNSSQPFVVNTTANIFENLIVGVTYEFQVEDSCGNQRLLPTQLGSLLPLVVANKPVDANGNSELLVCVGNNETTASFNIKSFEASILGNQPASNYIITYHSNALDAASGADPLTSPHTTASNHETIYVRVMHKTIGICYAVTSFDLFVGQKPVITTSADVYLCDGKPIRLYAQSGYQQYEWSTGETTSSIMVDSPGTYTVSAMNLYGTSVCKSDTMSITVSPSGIPTKLEFEFTDWTDNQNTITVIANGNGRYEYSIDGVNYQDSPVFTGLQPGVYKVYVNDKNNCGEFYDEVVLLNYPRFFTPNGDGYNDRWQIENAVFEPKMQIFIYDRYGKLLTGFDSKSPGWDGTVNGQKMPSTDYWFVVERADGRILKGHFALKR